MAFTGLALDVTHRKLYYTNMGSVTAHAQTHSWHRIELIDLDDGDRKTIVSDVEKPRGLHVDAENGSAGKHQNKLAFKSYRFARTTKHHYPHFPNFARDVLV